MYTDTSIDNIRNADIVRVVGNFIELKRAGKNLMAKSPFGDDRTASFCVTPSLNIWKCFSTGKGGDAIKFVQEFKQTNFPETLKIIADICGIVLEEEKLSEDAERKKSYRQELFDLTSNVAGEYQKQLHKLDPNHWTKQMITKREINDETLTKFSIVD